MKTVRHWPPVYTEEQIREAFWAKVRKSDGCWEWTAYRNPGGYGRFSSARKHVLAHRFSWSLINGSVPDGMDLCHHCDNRSCVRPDHLFLGTRKANMEDAVAKGRTSKGSLRPHAKLTESDVADILRLIASGLTCSEVATRFNINVSSISAISRRERWTHVADPRVSDHG